MEPKVTRDETTNCYTFDVHMQVQVLATTADEAMFMVEQQGGYMTYRKQTLIKEVPVYEAQGEVDGKTED